MPFLKVQDLHTYFTIKQSLFTAPQYIKAVNGVSFSIKKGETVGLVGESGCGKSTLGRTILRLEPAFSGSIDFEDKSILDVKGKELYELRKKIQMVFQDPFSSLNPKMNIWDIFDEVLRIHSALDLYERKMRIEELLEIVGLNPKHLFRYPHEFSGGQRQRIGIARALAVQPSFIVADEPVSALDVSVQAQIINLFMDLQKKINITYLFIAHDLAVVEHISDRIIVMYLGKFIEEGKANEIISSPCHPYTEALISSVPSIKKREEKRIILKGDIPSPINSPSGCAFHPRCNYAKEICSIEEPKLKQMADSPSHLVACHFAGCF